ncbi:hypothetical protein BGX28_000403, partial [Mortierella sp. GBA30]
ALLFLATYHSSRLPLSSQSLQSQLLPQADKRRYIFVDLGANGADTLDVFLKHPGARYQYDYPRPEWATYEETEIFLFETNPVFNTHLVNANEYYDERGIKVTIFPSTVVDVKDGIRTFFLHTVNEQNHFWGSSIYTNHPDVVRSQIVKMDIEGSEYEVVPHLAEMSAWVVMDYLLVEWHSVDISGGSPEDVEMRKKWAEDAKTKLESEGVKMPHYDSAG